MIPNVFFDDNSKKKWTPRKLGAPVFWYRMDKNIILNGSTIATIKDNSNNGFDLTQGTTARQLAYNAGSGRPYASSDGVDDTIGNTGDVWPTGDFTLFYVGDSISGGNTGEWISKEVSGGDEDLHFYGGTETQFRRVSTGPIATVSARVPFMAAYTALNRDEKIYINNAGPISTSTTRPLTSNNRKLFILGGGAAAPFPRKAIFREALCFNRALSANEILQAFYFWFKPRHNIT